MIRKVLATLVTGATLSTGAMIAGPVAPAVGRDCPGGRWPTQLDGRPTEVAVGMTGMALWRDGRVWKLRVSEAGRDPALFTGVISTDGRIVAVAAHLERGDRIVRRSPSKIVYGFSNFGGVDGVNFGAACASQVTIGGRLNGVRLDPTTVYLGVDNAHPGSVPFTIEKEAGEA